MMPLVSQIPGPTGIRSWPGGSSSATRSAVETSGAVAIEIEAPDRAVATLRRHHHAALRRAVLVDHQVLVADVEVVRADRDVAARGDHRVGVVLDGQRAALRHVARMELERVEPAEHVGAGGTDRGHEEVLVPVPASDATVIVAAASATDLLFSTGSSLDSRWRGSSRPTASLGARVSAMGCGKVRIRWRNGYYARWAS